MPSAQELFRTMLRDHAAPALRSLGFTGSGKNYTLPDAGRYLLVGFQSSTSSTAEGVRFTVNLAVIDKQEWADNRADWWASKPTATLHYPVGRYLRIGELMPSHQDHWWRLDARTDPSALSAEVAAAIREFGLPELRP